VFFFFLLETLKMKSENPTQN